MNSKPFIQGIIFTEFIERNLINDGTFLPIQFIGFVECESIKTNSFDQLHFFYVLPFLFLNANVQNTFLIPFLPLQSDLSIMVHRFNIFFLIVHHLNNNYHLLICLLKYVLYQFHIWAFFFLFLLLVIVLTNTKLFYFIGRSALLFFFHFLSIVIFVYLLDQLFPWLFFLIFWFLLKEFYTNFLLRYV